MVSNYSGLAVVPNPNELGGSGSAQRDMVFGLAQEASSGDGESSEEQVRRTITMVTNLLPVYRYLIQVYKYLTSHFATCIVLVSKWFHC